MSKFFLLPIFVFCGNPAWSQRPLSPKEKLWEERVERAWAWMRQGDEEGCLKTLDSCEHWLRLPAIPKAQKAGIMSHKGNALKRLGRLQEAVVFHQKSLAIRASLFGSRSEEVARSSQNLFNCYWDMGDRENAAKFARQNLSIREQLLPPGDTGLLLPLMNAGDALLELSRPEQAELLFGQALQISVKTVAEATPRAAKLLRKLAHCFHQKGQYQRSLDTLARAWAILKVLPQAPSLEKCKCLKLQADCLFEMGDANAALPLYRSGLSLCSSSPADSAHILLSLGRLHRYLGELDEAGEYLKEAVFICESGSAQAQLREIYHAALLQLGSVYMERERPDLKAAAYYFGEALTAASPDIRVSARLKLGRCHIAQQHLEAAEAVLGQALKEAIALRGPAKQFAAHYYLGELARAKKDHQKAASHYRSALQSLGGEAAFPYETIQAKAALCLAYKRLATDGGRQTVDGQRHWEQAKTVALEGIEALEALRGRFSDAQSEMDVQEAFFQLFNIAIEATFSLQAPNAGEEAFALTERYRGNLLRKFARQAQDLSGGGAEFRRLQSLLAEAEQRRFEVSGGSAFPLRQQEIKRLDSMMVAYRQQLHTLRAASGEGWEAIENAAPPASTAAIRRGLRSGQTLLEYHWGDGQLFVFLLRQDTFLVKTLPLAKELAADIMDFFALCNQNPGWLPTERQVAFPGLAHRLYARLMAPLKPWLTPELTIVPDAELHYLPFDALLTLLPSAPHLYWEYRYLVLSHSISYAYAASPLPVLGREKARHDAPLLAIAPGFEGDSRQHLQPLIHNEAEAKLARQVFGGRSLLGKEALKPDFIRLATGQRILLFSTHGVLDDRNPGWSYLAFSEIPDTLKNEHLYAWEIYGLPLDADLVILSACQTATGQLYRGEGLMSLARAFQSAGASTVVASLWNVDDRQTPLLMERYFENLMKKMPKSLALTEAKRRYLVQAQSLKKHPFFWSGFVSIGEDGALDGSGEKGWGELAAMGVAALLGLYLLLLGLRKRGVLMAKF